MKLGQQSSKGAPTLSLLLFMALLTHASRIYNSVTDELLVVSFPTIILSPKFLVRQYPARAKLIAAPADVEVITCNGEVSSAIPFATEEKEAATLNYSAVILKSGWAGDTNSAKGLENINDLKGDYVPVLLASSDARIYTELADRLDTLSVEVIEVPNVYDSNPYLAVVITGTVIMILVQLVKIAFCIATLHNHLKIKNQSMYPVAVVVLEFTTSALGFSFLWDVTNGLVSSKYAVYYFTGNISSLLSSGTTFILALALREASALVTGKSGSSFHVIFLYIYFSILSILQILATYATVYWPNTFIILAVHALFMIGFQIGIGYYFFNSKRNILKVLSMAHTQQSRSDKEVSKVYHMMKLLRVSAFFMFSTVVGLMMAGAGATIGNLPLGYLGLYISFISYALTGVVQIMSLTSFPGFRRKIPVMSSASSKP